MHAEQREMRKQRRALKDARALLADQEVRRLDRELMVDGVTIGRDRPLPSGRGGAGRLIVRPRFLRAEEDRDRGSPGGCDKTLGSVDCSEGVYVAVVGGARE